ncbi:hypothetical protein [Clostridium tetanomorphum]|uniref:hypothetical protein n=1 Tax=Clostridium tetanomorphum TaxID=1553 RepID=UPI000D9BF041|nr:hypothetical protein [Clostridium tetanomorphum]SQC00758.1 Uncharacterised protein [Clostridium tetanomorphum]
MADLEMFEDYESKYLNIQNDDWIPIYEEEGAKNELESDIFGFSALIDNDEEYIKKYLGDYEWGFSPNTFGKSYFEKYIAIMKRIFILFKVTKKKKLNI